MNTVDLDRAKYLLDYDRTTGNFTRKIGVKGSAAGDIVGGLTEKGYVAIVIDGARVRAHRLAWAFEYGEFPSFEIGHKDRNRSNNRIDNLRPASRSQQMQNRDSSGRNTSGATGVYQLPSGRWRARICKGRKYIHLGYFDSRGEASEAYNAAATKLFGEFKRD